MRPSTFSTFLAVFLSSSTFVWALTEYQSVVIVKNFEDNLLDPLVVDVAKRGNRWVSPYLFRPYHSFPLCTSPRPFDFPSSPKLFPFPSIKIAHRKLKEFQYFIRSWCERFNRPARRVSLFLVLISLFRQSDDCDTDVCLGSMVDKKQQNWVLGLLRELQKRVWLYRLL